ncbi:MAG: response regulator [Deltaproteobacteria bacterium]|nr:response regulator [Deltaproteobacteria bacterium]
MKVEMKPDSISVLVVDDEQDIRDGSERILTRVGFHVLKASRGDEALEMLPKEKVSIVLLDLKMPGMDGMEVLKHIRTMDETILVIIITGYATVETAIEAMKRGAYDFISKPFTPDQLRIVVNRAWEKIYLRQEAEKLEEERKRTLSDLDTEKSRIHTIIEYLPNGVIVTNSKLLCLDPDMKTGQPIDSYIPDQDLCDLVMEISQGKHVDYEDIPDYEFSIAKEKFLLARGQPVLGERKECLGAVINVVDISSMKILDQLKSEFVAKVSHELRSPLSTIHEQLALVIRDMMEEVTDQDQQILARAKEKTKGLIALIGDLLDLSRIEEGLICRDPKPVQIEALLGSVVDFLRTQAKGKGQSITLDLSKEPIPRLMADPVALESIFGNLITNAINYTQAGGSIHVQADMAGTNLRVKVIDNGFGIDGKYFDKIFDRFYRIKDEKTRYITGTGLGLPIVKELVDSMGGLIDLESTLGEGTTFTVLLPIQRDL